MSSKWSLMLQGMGILFLAMGLALWTESSALAQCGETPAKSSCITCHETEDPVYGKGEWHTIHARKECCTNCHGGNCSAKDKDLAHVGLVANPLNDIYTSCHGCHPDDYTTRAERFAIALGVTLYSRPTSTPVPIVSMVDHPMVILPQSALAATNFESWNLALLAVIFIVVILLSLSILYYHFHTRA
jgi:hypothetical protein